jgi:glycosyltransferase involved in cell wall biosynthesis
MAPIPDEPSANSTLVTDNVQISVIIPVYNDTEGLKRCADALSKQDFPRDSFEVVVIENGPAEGAAARLDEVAAAVAAVSNSRVLHEPRRGSYAARNLGLSVTSGSLIVFTDSDCIPSPQWLSTSVAYLDEHPDVDAVAGKVELYAHDPNVRTGAELYELVHAFPQERYVETVGFGATANLVTRRQTIDAIGPFDANLQSGGDKEWGTRLRKHGGRMVFVADICVRHPTRHSMKELALKSRRVVKGDVVLRHRQNWSRLNWLRYSLQPLRPPLRTIWRARRDTTIRSRSELLRYAAAFVLIRWITAIERLRALPSW